MLSGLFSIGSTDYTKFEDTTQHNVNREDVFETWIDGNWRERRVVARTRVSGSVFLRFPRSSDFEDFLGDLESAKSENGTYSVSVWCSNTGSVEAVTAYLDVTGETKWDVTAPIKWNGLTIQITEV